MFSLFCFPLLFVPCWSLYLCVSAWGCGDQLPVHLPLIQLSAHLPGVFKPSPALHSSPDGSICSTDPAGLNLLACLLSLVPSRCILVCRRLLFCQQPPLPTWPGSRGSTCPEYLCLNFPASMFESYNDVSWKQL